MKRSVVLLKLKNNWQLHIMMLPVVILLGVFCYVPMAGIAIAFQDYLPTKGMFGSEWIGLENYAYLFTLREFPEIMRNTIIISCCKIFFGLIISVFFAVVMSQCRSKKITGLSQLFIFFPWFISWVILGGIFVDIFSVRGIINALMSLAGIEPIMFMGKPVWFVVVIVVTDIWKGYGYNMIIFYAAILGIDQTLYESAVMDGAGRIRQIFSITIPCILPMITVMGLLSLGSILNAGFDQIFNMYNPLVYKTGDILDTYIYRIGIVGGQYSFATAVGLFKSLVGMVLIVFGNWSAKRFAGYRIF